jgi:hypothetical protein
MNRQWLPFVPLAKQFECTAVRFRLGTALTETMVLAVFFKFLSRYDFPVINHKGNDGHLISRHDLY